MSGVDKYSCQDIDQSDEDAILRVLRSDFLTQGSATASFAECINSYTGSSYSVTYNSATSALHSACLAVGICNGDMVWTSPNSFVASANVALYCGANIDFIDIDPDTRNISVDLLDEKLAEAARIGKLPKALIVVHFAGYPCDMKRIHSSCRNFGVAIIEDASHALGARYLDSWIGDCRYSDITVFSFHPVKMITTAEGGVATTNNRDFHEKLLLIQSHGVTRNAEKFEFDSDGPWYYEQIRLGYNYRMSDLHAALGVSQMARLSSFVEKRNKVAEFYQARLNTTHLKLPMPNDASFYSSYHLYVVELTEKNLSNTDRRNLFNQLRERGVGVNVHYKPIPLQPFYANSQNTFFETPNAIRYHNNCLSIPMHTKLDHDDMEFVVSTLIELT